MYNVAKFLEECLNSIKSQTYKNFLAIMINDGSSDTSAQIAKAFAQHDSRFILLENPQNQGIGVARNTGLEYIFSTLKPQINDYIGFVDSDDVIAQDYYENLIFCLESCAKYGVMVAKSFNVYCFNDASYNRAIFSYRGSKIGGLAWNLKCGITTKGGKIAQWITLYRAPFLEHLRFPNARFLGEDVVFGNITNALAGQVAYTRNARYFYRQRAGSLVKNWQYHYDEQFSNFAYMLGEFVKFDLLRRNEIDTSLVENMPFGRETECFKELQNLVASYHLSKQDLQANPRLKAILNSRDYTEFRAYLAKQTPFSKRLKRYFQIDIRFRTRRKIYLKFFGKVLCDKSWR